VGILGYVPQPWNVNIHYDATLARLAHHGARSALDVGCGDGFLSARLARSGLEVVAVDADAPVVDRARARFPDVPVDWVVGDVMVLPLAAGSFDLVVSNATLHHLGDPGAALERLGDLVRPGGRLGVVCFVRPRWVDLPWWVIAFVARGAANRVRGKWEHTAPTSWPPAYTLAGLRRAASRLPGARTRRLVLGRVLVTWERPALTGSVSPTC
jgi:SAM-dependent methyltransferase